ncbi:SPOR domain-containing protein [Cognatiluteimonas weifangensis]|uniref:SPOR domain-containing protein n=1 Tax=Cognatiluteimonas weifangensis TaxID=2303539 RepID=UPI003615EB02
MAARRGKSQARRNNGNGAGLPGWAWMVLGIVLTVVAVLAAPKLLKSDQGDGFFRPRPNPDAQPAVASAEAEDAIVPEGSAGSGDPPAATADKPKGTQYDFYTLLPADEVAMSDAELAATARAEAARQAQQAAAVAADPAAAPAGAAADAAAPADAAPTATAASGNDTPYLLQAGAFGASGDAEAVKARIALLGLGARVESASIGGKTVYRVRMGPYGSASELAEAKRKLASGGLPALAIKAK